jgi:transposase
MTSVSHASSYVGIDVSKDKLDLAIDGQSDVVTFANEAEGIASLIQRLQQLKPELIVVEATGGYERGVLHAALDATLPISRVQPGRVRHFARAQGLLAKSDGIDARLLAVYARCLQPAVTDKRSKISLNSMPCWSFAANLSTPAPRTPTRRRSATTPSSASSSTDSCGRFTTGSKKWINTSPA